MEKPFAVVLAIIVVIVTIVLLVVGMQGLHALTHALISLGYLGAFLSGVLGTSSLMISVFPPQIVVFLMSTPKFGLSPFLIGVSAGLGAGIGQYMHYYIGASGRLLVSGKHRLSMDKWKTRLNKYGPFIIFIFAVAPLTPDDLIWIPLGMMKYPKLKAFISAAIGKIVMFLTCAYGGYYGIGLIQEYLVRLGG